MIRNSGGWMWLVLLALTAAYETWAASTDNQTMSEWVWLYTGGHGWFKVLFIGLTILLIRHLFFNGRS